MIASHGITPAGAGNTRPQSRAQDPKWDHPRGCGEYFTGFISSTTSIGSPPRVRGILKRDLETAFVRRITPAGAGNTFDDSCVFRLVKDHPRGCGEYGVTATMVPEVTGSPPRVRGILEEET